MLKVGLAVKQRSHLRERDHRLLDRIEVHVAGEAPVSATHTSAPEWLILAAKR